MIKFLLGLFFGGATIMITMSCVQLNRLNELEEKLERVKKNEN